MGTEPETEGELLPPTAAPSQANLATSFCLSLAPNLQATGNAFQHVGEVAGEGGSRQLG